MSPVLIVGYLALCLLVALLGCQTRLGFFRSFVFSIMLTPILVTLFLLILSTLDSKSKEPPRPAGARKSNS